MADATIRKPFSPRKDLTAEFVRAALHYDPETGIFHWRKDRPGMSRRWLSRYGSSVTGKADRHGHISLTINDTNYGAHRIAWLYMTGEWPPNDVDHRDGVRDNNRWSNLRAATRRQNLRNMRPKGSSGLKGVTWFKQSKKWRAQIRDDVTNRHLGLFETKEEAYAAYCEAAERLHGDFARLK